MNNNNTEPANCALNLLAIRDTLDILGGKWKLQILHYLKENEQNTFKKIERGLNGISAKVLSKELKELEANRLVDRKVISSKPITVEYSITKYGRTTDKITEDLIDWGKEHRKHLLNK